MIMLSRSASILSFACALIIVFYGCKKDEDTIAPIVNITTPYDSQFFSVYDTMSIAAEVSDETKLERITLSVVDKDRQPALHTVNIEVNGNKRSISFPYILFDLHLESGVYYVKISASDGRNETSSYRKINITAAPKERKGVYIISQAGTNTSVHFMEEDLSIVPKLTLAGDLSSSAINSYYQDLYVAVKLTGNMIGIDI